ncbi:MAG: hypothetical protein KBT49_02250 [Bacteroidetes bacterium]|nr:hypothetical protein [Candidatus Colenecus caballi]
METEEKYYHLFGNGNDAHNFITSESDFKAAFNMVGVCAANTNVSVLSFSIEDTHPHMLLFGRKEECVRFKLMYETSLCHHIVRTRGDIDNVRLECDLYHITDKDYLQNVAVYTIIQPTKDGKGILPSDYLWGTASLYFRKGNVIPIWLIRSDLTVAAPVTIGSLTERERRKVLACRRQVPDEWLVSNGILLPSNYIDIRKFEDIFVTANAFRVFMGNGNRKCDTISNKMAKVHGISLDDLEARKIAEEVCYALFEKKSARHLTPAQRLVFAQNLRRTRQMTFRQIAIISRLPESEIRKSTN